MRNLQQINGGKMKNIVLTRIDDRLLHGQVIVSWIPFLKIDEIVIVDDEYASDEFMSTLMKEAAPDYIKVNVLSVNESAEYLNSGQDDTNLLLISRYVENIEKLINLNVRISKVNIGGLGFCEGRKKYLNAIHMSELELNILKNISEKGIAVEVQMLPRDKVIIL
jgi:PTS system mannose-specific IIB component